MQEGGDQGGQEGRPRILPRALEGGGGAENIWGVGRATEIRRGWGASFWWCSRHPVVFSSPSLLASFCFSDPSVLPLLQQTRVFLTLERGVP